MNVDGKPTRTIWPSPGGGTVQIIDQTRLPFELVLDTLATWQDAARAISTMQVRGAPLIGATAAWGVALAMIDSPANGMLDKACAGLISTRPTAVNLRWALQDMQRLLGPMAPSGRAVAAWQRAIEVTDKDVEMCRAIGENGLALIQAAHDAKGKDEPVNILTHCNAGWLATVDWGTATAPVYMANDAGIQVHVWVDETRPRNQGASLTAWELGHHGVPHTVIADNTGGHLMQHGMVDLCIVGTDRTAASGDVANKIGTYLKALAAHDNDVPFYVALPSSTIDWTITDGVCDIPIEQRNAAEVTDIAGRAADGSVTTVRLVPDGSKAANYAFDVTPARLVTGLITERGICLATVEGLAGLYPEHAGLRALGQG